jgi:hypothetical protein
MIILKNNLENKPHLKRCGFSFLVKSFLVLAGKIINLIYSKDVGINFFHSLQGALFFFLFIQYLLRKFF